MASKIIMPKQGLQMETGIITQWLHGEGDEIKEGEPLFEMETDKLTITIDASAGGTLLKILAEPGEAIPVAATIAIVGQPGEDISALVSEATAASGGAPAAQPEAPTVAPEAPAPAAPAESGGRKFISPRAKTAAEERGIDYSGISGTGTDGLVIERDILAYEAGRLDITPLAANVARLNGVDASAVKGTGPNGKVTVADVSAAGAVPKAAAASPRGSRVEPMNGMRRAIARNMMASKTTNAQASHRMAVDMTQIIQLREAFKAMNIKISYNDIIIRICAQALREMPIVNASIDGNNIVYHDYVNIGLAVSVPGGLIVPVVKDADIIGLTEIAARSRALVDKAHSGALTTDDYHGGTFTVTSLGMFDVDDFVAIINPPESAILAVGKICKTPVVVTGKDGADEIAIRPMCALTLGYDHRSIDGAEAAKFLQKIKQYAQNPALML